MKEQEKLHFSYDLEASRPDAERSANLKIKTFKDQLITPMYSVVVRDFYETRSQVENSTLYQILDKMPKGALHHIHTSAAPPVDVYVKLTYDPIVYFNEREGIFKVFPQHEKEDGYVSCVEMRNYSSSAEAYDQHLKEAILLMPQQTKGRESHDIWINFQHKFTKVTELGKYYKFFRILLKETINSCTA